MSRRSDGSFGDVDFPSEREAPEVRGMDHRGSPRMPTRLPSQASAPDNPGPMTTAPSAGPMRCRLCRSRDTCLVLEGHEFDVIRCRHCGSGLAQFRRRAAHHALEDFDHRYEADADEGKATQCWKLLNRVVGTRPGQRLLDVGCGRGAFLDVARAHGLHTTGLEPASGSAAIAGERHPLISRGVDALTPAEGQFDLITLWDVLEHLDDPGQSLRSLRPLLSPGGSLAILTPMMGSAYDRLALASHRMTRGKASQLLRMCWSEDHLTRFQPDGLQRFLLELQFSPISIRRVLVLSLQLDRYAGGSVLPPWTSSSAGNRFLSLLGVGLARVAHLHNKVFVCASTA